MLNRVYRLVSPRTFEPLERQVDVSDSVVVRPTHLSICKADQRYYQGNRSAEVLAKKLPMALIHEGIGEVVFDATHTFKRGQVVVMLPNAPFEEDAYIAENYLRSSRFCGSGFDGMMQEYMVLPSSRVLALPDGINKNVAAFTELISVAVHSVTRFDEIAHGRRDVLGVWGDGNMGFIVSLVLRAFYPESRIVLFGRNRYKMDDFTFVDETYLTSEALLAPAIDHAFECCGGDGSTSAIDQVIDIIRPEGTLALLGVSENPVPINTRMVLEKGMRLVGNSRSGRSDFIRTIQMYEDHPETVDYLRALVGDVVRINDIKDISFAFESDMRRRAGKTIMEWNL